jgi:hypothetical protein
VPQAVIVRLLCVGLAGISIGAFVDYLVAARQPEDSAGAFRRVADEIALRSAGDSHSVVGKEKMIGI